MDETTVRINGVVSEEMAHWLKIVAKRNGWTFSRAIRWAIYETMERDYALAEEAFVREHPEVMQPSGKTAAESFPDDLPEDQT